MRIDEVKASFEAPANELRIEVVFEDGAAIAVDIKADADGKLDAKRLGSSLALFAHNLAVRG